MNEPRETEAPAAPVTLTEEEREYVESRRAYQHGEITLVGIIDRLTGRAATTPSPTTPADTLSIAQRNRVFASEDFGTPVFHEAPPSAPWREAVEECAKVAEDVYDATVDFGVEDPIKRARYDGMAEAAHDIEQAIRSKLSQGEGT